MNIKVFKIAIMFNVLKMSLKAEYPHSTQLKYNCYSGS